jgi:hypothetical protein
MIVGIGTDVCEVDRICSSMMLWMRSVSSSSGHALPVSPQKWALLFTPVPANLLLQELIADAPVRRATARRSGELLALDYAEAAVGARIAKIALALIIPSQVTKVLMDHGAYVFPAAPRQYRCPFRLNRQ